MAKYDHILKQELKDVYFIWGSGKTTVAEALAEKYSFPVYHTEESRNKYIEAEQEQDPEEAGRQEREILRDITPMVVSELIELSERYGTILCEGELDVDAIVPIATHVITISNSKEENDILFSFEEQQNRKGFMIKQIIREEATTVDEMVEEVAEYFGFCAECPPLS